MNLTGGAGGLDAAWSPDGKRVAFTSIRKGGGFLLYVADADGANVKELSTNPNPWGNVYPAWSPDGKQLAFTDWVAGVAQIAIVDPEGKDRKVLTKEGTHWLARWSPDGKTIAYVRSLKESTDLWITSVDGKTQREILRGVSTFAWRPKK